MEYAGPVLQWELFSADLQPSVGREQGGESRPVLIVSNDGFNRFFDVVTVLPLTRREGKKRRVFPFEALLPGGLAGNPVDSIVMPQQIRTISKARLLQRMGVLNDRDLRREIEDRILEHLGIALDDDS